MNEWQEGIDALNTSMSNIGSCMPAQVVQLTFAVNDFTNYQIFNGNGCQYDNSCIEIAWSYDGTTWSCFADYDSAMKSLINASSDYFVKFKVKGEVSDVKDNDGNKQDYTTSIDNSFQLPSCDSSKLKYNPYAGLSAAMTLQQSLSDSVACMIGIPIYYFKLKANNGGRDITFKEYTLMDIDAVKQIKLIITDGQMPSSKPEFSDFGIDFQTDWETEISKSMFATAFGKTAQPMEGDLIYIPMMKRMWMVNEAYEEKKDALMWNATTFKLALVKYQEKSSVDLGDTQEVVDSFVKNKYEDLFGDKETLASTEEATDSPNYAADNLYPIYESDETRKYITCKGIEFNDTKLWHRGTLIADRCYAFDTNINNLQIIYQRKYCGTDCSASFVIGIHPNYTCDEDILDIADISIHLKQTTHSTYLSILNSEESKIKLPMVKNNTIQWWFVYARWSKQLNVCELAALPYTYRDGIPLWKLQPAHYYFDSDNIIKSVKQWNIELIQTEKKDVVVHGFPGAITNIKVIDVYDDNVTELMQQYPNNQHMIVNDCARKIIELNGTGV